MEHPHLASAQLILFPQGCRLLHHGGGVIAVQGFLIDPFIDQEQAVRIVCREEVVIAEAPSTARILAAMPLDSISSTYFRAPPFSEE